MPRETLLPIYIEFCHSENVKETRVLAAINEEQVENLENRLKSGVMMRFGIEYQMSARQRERREERVRVLKGRVDEDVGYIRNMLPRIRMWEIASTDRETQGEEGQATD